MRIAGAALLLLAVAVLAVSRFWPLVERIEVSGHAHYDAATVARIARVTHGDPLLWITAARTVGLERDPWIRRARVTRHWPDTVSVVVWERAPVARLGSGAEAVAIARDGTVLPGVAEGVRAELPAIVGWGPDRNEEALDLLEVLRDRQPVLIEYSPEGFVITLPEGTVSTPDLEALTRQWAAVERHRGGRLAVYPWGVSWTHE